MNQISDKAKNEEKKRMPEPRPEIFDLYWIFAAKRQEIFERRIAGQAEPWTDDPILKEFKFCNVFRAADRVSQYLIREVAYGPAKDSVADRLFRIIAFRTFSKPETWRALISRLGREPSLEDLASGAFENALDNIKKVHGGLYTGAFILCANKVFGFTEKHKNHVALFKQMFFEREAASRIQKAGSLGELVEFLQSFPLTGPFMSYQLAVDINYSDIVDFDENSFTQAGPGALRGIAKAFVDFGDYTPAEIIQLMVLQQKQEFQRLGLKFRGLWGRPLHAIDCQGLFCELDKYCREAAPHLLSNRSRIKTRFSASVEPFPLFFPPKWKLNDKLPLVTPARAVRSKEQLLFHGINQSATKTQKLQRGRFRKPKG
jgi:hypothetical protein